VPALPPAEQPGSPEDLVRVLHAEGIRTAGFWPRSGRPRAEFVPPAAAGQAYVDAPNGVIQPRTGPCLQAFPQLNSPFHRPYFRGK
jgi:hypothetical protein